MLLNLNSLTHIYYDDILTSFWAFYYALFVAFQANFHQLFSNSASFLFPNRSYKLRQQIENLKMKPAKNQPQICALHQPTTMLIPLQWQYNAYTTRVYKYIHIYK